ncbi:MAG: AAA family ATPase [Thermoleophilaceae bacterium]
MLVGRDAERRRLDALLQSARDARSAVLVIRGDPGIGKTALLEYAAEQAKDMNVLRCVGIEAEHELPFAGMHQLVRPCLGLLDRLPKPQRDALRGALGLSEDRVEDRFLVSLGLLSLLAEACEEGPVLCCVDDAQWLDRPSAEALAFAARRFEAEPIAVLLAVREGELRRFEPNGLPELELLGLDAEDSRALLCARFDRGASPAVLDMLLTAGAGNPLALLELPAALSSAQLQGIEPILGPPPVRPAVEEAFRTRVEALSEPTARVLLIASADETGDLAAIRRAAEQLGLDATVELEAAEHARLVQLNGTVAFRHPLVRSAVYRSAGRSERKAVHEALAAAVSDPVLAAWHRALVADGTDEAIAAELEEAAVQSVARGAHATASAAFERAADLSENDASKGHRLQRAAQASVDAGRPEAALALAERARPLVQSILDEASLNFVRSAVVGRRGSPEETYALVSDAAEKLAESEAAMALEVVLWSWPAGFQGGWGERVLEEAIERVDRIGPEGDTKRFAGRFLEGAQALVAGDMDVARLSFDAASEIAERVDSDSRTHFGTGPLLFLSGFWRLSTGDLSRARQLLLETLAKHRAHGGISVLAGTLPLCAFVEITARRPTAAATLVAEGLEIAEELGFDNDTAALLAIKARVAALQGREDECRQCVEAALTHGIANGLGWATTIARLALAELELGLGDSHKALEHFEQLNPTMFPAQALLATPDLVDAALRAGEPERARAPLERFAAWAPVSREPLVAGMLARCRGMMSEDPGEAKRLFTEGLASHAGDVPSFESARTQLAYGERLRRDRHRVEARAQLRPALEVFEGVGARLWAERARGELNATGETARKRDDSTRDDLTPQELRIAQLVAGGATNRDVAAQLFVSPKTVEYHLHKVFLKLGVKSRIELVSTSL